MERKKRELHTDLPPRSEPGYMKAYLEKHKERHKLLLNDWKKRKAEEDPNYWKDKYDETKAKAYRESNRAVLSEKSWKKYGIVDMTYDRYLDELVKQDNKCKICDKELTKPHVDHDHNTGRYRGMLCTACNNGLGIFEKNKVRFQKYLDETGLQNDY